MINDDGKPQEVEKKAMFVGSTLYHKIRQIGSLQKKKLVKTTCTLKISISFYINNQEI